jgi:methylmalonyl-CoA epimerase
VAAREIHHVGVAVDDLDRAIETYTQLFGAIVEHREVVPDQGVEACALRVGGDRIELLRPLGPETPVGRFLASRGPGLHHVAYRVDDVAAELERVAATGARLVDERPRPGLFGMQVAFVHPEATGGVLAEFVSDG